MKRALVVDDDPSIRRIAEITLTAVGNWEVLTTDSGAKAIDLLPVYCPDFVLLDVMMPGMDGPTTFSKMKAINGNVLPPVILMTAKVQRTEVQAYYELGVAGVIAKPFDPLMLPVQIRNILNTQVGKACIA